jgi:hypothetical protein
MFATLASDKPCEIDFQSMFMKVIWSTANYLSTIDTNLGLIRCLQHWHLVSLESKITLKFLVIGCCATLFRALRTAFLWCWRWDAEEGHGDPSQACIYLMPVNSTV